MMGEQLDLSGAIKQHIIIPEPSQPLLEPLHVPFQLLERVHHAAIRPQPFLRHHFLQRHYRPYVQRARVAAPLVRRVEVYDAAFPSDR